MSRFPRLRVGVRWTVVAVAVVSLILYGAVATSKHYPRRSLHTTASSFNGLETFVNDADGSLIVYEGGAFTGLTRPHVISPPQPSLLRVWSPVLAGAAASFAVVGVALYLTRRPPRAARLRAAVAAAVTAAAWLVAPALWIVSDPKNDYHTHDCSEVLGRRSVHVTPFWPRYGRLLLGRPWPGDYVCPTSHRLSLAAPPLKF